MLNELYNAKILELAGNIPLNQQLDDPDGASVQHSKMCGSRIGVDIKMKNGVVSEYAHEVKACALGQAAASIMAKNVVGSTPDELQEVRDKVFAMLKENGEPPSGKWGDIAALEPVREVKARHASTMLVFDAVCEAVEVAKNVKERV